MAKRANIDPALLPEVRMDRMREEMYRLRRAVLSLVPERYRDLIDPPYNFTQEEGRHWDYEVVSRIIELVKPDAEGRSACPLCGDTTQSFGVGFSVPTGLERHLLGSHRSRECDVMYAAKGLLRGRHRKLYPEDFGPYGCD
ncbi:hypothetical protein MTMN5_00043 [Marinobacter salarius]|jgi:hypothetical protein|nr:hypothetical protein MTMN5_00043 [Marinobacter salarius]